MLWIADTGNNAIRSIDLTVGTLAYYTSPTQNATTGVAAFMGSVWASDANNHRILFKNGAWKVIVVIFMPDFV